jgi:hypothetical protein
MGGFYPHVERGRSKSTPPGIILVDVRRWAALRAGVPELALKAEWAGGPTGSSHGRANGLDEIGGFAEGAHFTPIRP